MFGVHRRKSCLGVAASWHRKSLLGCMYPPFPDDLQTSHLVRGFHDRGLVCSLANFKEPMSPGGGALPPRVLGRFLGGGLACR